MTYRKECLEKVVVDVVVVLDAYSEIMSVTQPDISRAEIRYGLTFTCSMCCSTIKHFMTMLPSDIPSFGN